ncbi:ribosome silencing factor [Candidatus Berkiella cookevillensis]|uniref:Ribosomal silencing factor RsfS n=1 Tax=Candidatus Berkiella cookevillensis TaxID=437022 RepID=A0A0Q9YRD7_9GAMM|nr:ribosome silencing factor [Candidatus Berkiella cookevillensis]MCS5707875.1 ribosome silencing factor [Candidatus Berkiella cookevillensis]
MRTEDLLHCTLNDLSDLKAVNVRPIDVRKITPLADYMVIATGNSSRHVRSIAENLITHMKGRMVCPGGIEGDKDDEWVLVDLGDVIVHIMQQRTRDFYNLEKLWAPVYQDQDEEVALA